MSRCRVILLLAMLVVLCPVLPVRGQATDVGLETRQDDTVLPAARGIYDQELISPSTTATQPDAAGAAPKPLAAPQLDPQRIALALGIVLAIIFVLVWLYRRIFGGASLPRSSSVMKILGRMPISAKQHVVLLQVGRRVVVVADNGAQMTPLSQIEDPDEVAGLVGQIAQDHAVAASSTFGSWFGRARGTYAEEPPAEMPPSAGMPDGVLEDDAQVDSARGELSGLMDKVRLLSQQFRRTS
jgi:flagellar biogenesis protein FliO